MIDKFPPQQKVIPEGMRILTDEIDFLFGIDAVSFKTLSQISQYCALCPLFLWKLLYFAIAVQEGFNVDVLFHSRYLYPSTSR